MAEVPYSKEVGAMSDLIKKDLTIDEHGNATLPDDVFEKTLVGTDLTFEDVKKVHDHRDLVLAGTALALGESGVEEFKKHGNLEQVNVDMKVHRDRLGGIFHRSRETSDGKGGRKTSLGATQMKYSANGQIKTKGQLSKVAKHTQALAEEALAD